MNGLTSNSIVQNLDAFGIIGIIGNAGIIGNVGNVGIIDPMTQNVWGARNLAGKLAGSPSSQRSKTMLDQGSIK